MKGMIIVAVAGAAGLIVGGGLGLPYSAQASSKDSAVNRLAELNPGSSPSEVVSQVERLAAEKGITRGEMLQELLKEAEESAAASSSTEDDKLDSSGDGEKNYPLGEGDRAGDVFWSPASTLFIAHGHTGIYYNKRVVVEAPGLGKMSHSTSAITLKVGKGAQKLSVNTTDAKRKLAASYAYNHMRNKPYNIFFDDNKHVPADSYNCSQLVWGAYKITSNIDLDGNGGSGVYPNDIRDSRLTTRYETVK